MRSRATILTTLVLGLLLSTSGAGLAISGFADNDQAAVAQYHEGRGGGGVLPGSAKKSRPGASVQPGRQTEALVGAGNAGQLPFTGFAAIPVLLFGIGLFGTGLVLRRAGRRA